MPLIHLSVGREVMQDEDLAENILNVYETVESKLPARNQNVKSVIVKLTMGPSIKIGEESAPKNQNAKKEKKLKTSTIDGGKKWLLIQLPGKKKKCRN